MVFTGLLIKESLANPAAIDFLTVTNSETVYPNNATSDQSDIWTLISYQDNDSEAKTVAKLLSTALKVGKWYTNFTTSDGRVFVIFPGRVFSYAVGDKKGRLGAQDYALKIGIPPDQLDWAE
jgi:hypothetical protein